jgi:SAM-dependent methyltransferase
MHEEALDFLARVKKALPEHFQRKRVLEVGSYMVNGSPRAYFEGCDYLGCDWRSGPGVDVVGFAHELDFAEASFDVVLSTECLEHDIHWRDTLVTMMRVLKPGGLLIVTAAAFDRRPPELDCAVDGYYRNLQPEDLMQNLDGVVLYEENRLFKGIHVACVKPRAGRLSAMLGRIAKR